MIAAKGLTAVQLPDLKFEDIAGLKQYPDKPLIEDKPDSTGITGYKQIKVALIPARAGTYTLPEIKLQWWNTKTSKQEVAIIPETVITAIVDINADSGITTLPATENATSVSENMPTDNKVAQPATLVTSEPTYWKWLAAFFACLWLITLLFLFKKPKTSDKNSANKIKCSQSKHSIASARNKIGRASCRERVFRAV